MTDELEKHVHKKFEIMAKLGKGVRAAFRAGNRPPVRRVAKPGAHFVRARGFASHPA